MNGSFYSQNSPFKILVIVCGITKQDSLNYDDIQCMHLGSSCNDTDDDDDDDDDDISRCDEKRKRAGTNVNNWQSIP